MQVKLIGTQNVRFTDNTGKEIAGTNLFVAFKDAMVEGAKTEKFFVKADMLLPENMKINDTVELVFNYKGKIESITKS